MEEMKTSTKIVKQLRTWKRKRASVEKRSTQNLLDSLRIGLITSVSLNNFTSNLRKKKKKM